ncbi:MAG: hypothetical protein DRO76_03085 [Candidatus Altiarchaeales archaeon]|nr:MAG: hypothetical protein DRO76_03085 [Candidatus Altiarchaeales archaeon]
MVDLIATGIEGFDDLIGGGFPPGTCILLITPPIIESRLFCLEYIYKGLLVDEPGMIITMDYSPESLKIRALQYGWILSRGEENKLLRWVDGYSLNAKKDVKSTDTIKRIGGSIALSDLTIGMSQIQRDFHQIKDYYRFIFDSLSTLFIYNDPNTIYRFLRVIISKLRMSGGVGFFTLGEGMHDPQIEMTLRYMMDGTIQIEDNLKINVLNLPTPSAAKSAQLTLAKTGFSVK